MVQRSMRLLSRLLFALAALTGACAVLVYGYAVNLACGYAPNASGCRGAPWALDDDDRFWLLGLPACIIAILTLLALVARRRRSREAASGKAGADTSKG